MKRLVTIVLLLAIVAFGALWATVRIRVESFLIEAALRDMTMLVDVVAIELDRVAKAKPRLRGAPLAEAVLADGASLAVGLQHSASERLRGVYFFDLAGNVVDARRSVPEAASASPPAPGIVRVAMGHIGSAPPTEAGSTPDAYRDAEGNEMIGAWRWMPRLELGIVVERPHERFTAPVAWIDRIFAGFLGLATLVAMLLGMPAPRAMLSGFRRSDIKQCGPYRIERLIGEGAMSNVYRARHQHLGRVVALKRLKIQAQSDELSARFDREARLASCLSHPNIVAVLDHGPVPGGGFYYTMEFIHGLTLTAWVEEHGPLPPARAVRVLRQICAGVGAMHAAGFLHRDIKPDNVMAYATNDDYDLVKLLDFGLIKRVETHATRDLTSSARALGTPAFMAPERLNDPRSIDPRTDLYGIGCIAFFLLTGRKPFEATLDSDLAQQILHIRAPDVSACSPFALPESLSALVSALLAKDPSQRPASAEALAAELAGIAAAVPLRIELARLWWQSAVSQPARDDGQPR